MISSFIYARYLYSDIILTDRSSKYINGNIEHFSHKGSKLLDEI